MSKLLLMSMPLALVILPILAARSTHPRRGLKRAIVAMVVFNVLYALAVQVGYFQLWLGAKPDKIMTVEEEPRR